MVVSLALLVTLKVTYWVTVRAEVGVMLRVRFLGRHHPYLTLERKLLSVLLSW